MLPPAETYLPWQAWLLACKKQKGQYYCMHNTVPKFDVIQYSEQNDVTFSFIFTRTRALLMYSSWHAFPFSFLPPQALRAEACRARPYEKVRAQGLCRGHWFMAFRLMEASSSLWPPDRKVMPIREEHGSLAKHFSRHLSAGHADYIQCSWKYSYQDFIKKTLCLQSFLCMSIYPAHQGLRGAQCGAGR